MIDLSSIVRSLCLSPSPNLESDRLLGILSELRGDAIPEVGTTTFRPPFSGLTFGAVAGLDRGDFFTPQRKTPMHPWHEARGAPIECVGDWLRPWYFPLPGEDREKAVQRECVAVRTRVGVADASPLGKIDLRGPDAAEFLNRIYTNAWSRLGIGRCRYGLMLNEQGHVFDDGVTTRLGDDHYHMTTTSGGAERVMVWLEDWLQTEWRDLKVYLTGVTDQWAVASLNGPAARAVLERLTDMDLSREAFPFMNLGRSIALGLVVDGRARHGEALFAQGLDGTAVPVRLTDGVFIDGEGHRARA